MSETVSRFCGPLVRINLPVLGTIILRTSFYALIPFHLLNIRPLNDSNDEYDEDILDFE